MTLGRIASLIATATLNGAEPFAHLEATLEAIAAVHRQKRIDDASAMEFQAINLRTSDPGTPLRCLFFIYTIYK
ncbi:transposase domain-containing protein [Mangrovicoccus ximenensis]|uniref:transposase domain-containing protein n=1 Tax=Mangrovicoccus ximenensis TaxID=1911570 RepID=UPI0038B28D44